MTNFDFYKDIIAKFAFSHEKVAVNKDTLELHRCVNYYCKNCLFQRECTMSRFIEWCNSECAFKIDPRITENTPIDTKILVSDDGHTWYNRHLAKIKNNKAYAWDNGTTSFTLDSSTSWTYAKLYEE